ncbi:MAG TPA: alkaline phosphatase family protein [Pseudomonadota bacterium]|nr:alkaline phosphatase family protein [Pseudomonadota bacterium]
MSCLCSTGGSEAQPAATRPRLVLVISIDQMRYDYLERFGKLFKGGFRTLMQGSAQFLNNRYRHANCETGPGHAVILSGQHGSHTGMIANSWYDQLLGKSVNLVEDPVHQPVGGKGRGASPHYFMGFTVGDVLKSKSPKSKVIGVSLKDRAAILMAGRRADAAYWYETAEGRFITSTYYMSQAPEWLNRWNEQKYADRYAGRSWTRLYNDERFYERYAGKDAVEGEWDRKDIVFPHKLRSAPPDKDFYDDVRRTPFADELTLDVAIQAMAGHQLGQDEHTDILAVGFSATDIVGHTYGPDSHEMMDQLLRLDLVLDQLLFAVNRSVGLKNTLVVLTADHGSQPLIETLIARGQPGRRLHSKELNSMFDAAFAQRFPGIKGLMAYFDPPNFYLNEKVIREHQLTIEEVTAVVIEVLGASGLVTAVYTQADLARGTAGLGAETGGDPYRDLFQNSYFGPRSGHVVARMKPYVYVDDRPGGTGHGMPYDYDRHVPLFFLAPNIKGGRYPQTCGPEDIAPTLARFIGLEYPLEYDSRVLTEILPKVPVPLLGKSGGSSKGEGGNAKSASPGASPAQSAPPKPAVAAPR